MTVLFGEAPGVAVAVASDDSSSSSDSSSSLSDSSLSSSDSASPERFPVAGGRGPSPKNETRLLTPGLEGLPICCCWSCSCCCCC